MMGLKLKKNKSTMILSSIIMFFAFANIIWFSQDSAPPMWDQSHYLITSEKLYHALMDEGVSTFHKAYLDAMGSKAPLMTVLPIPFYHFFGDNYLSALLVNIAFVIICSIYLYRLTAFLSDKNSAILSVVILNTFPLTFAMSREFLVEYGLMTLVVAWMFHAIRLDARNSRWDALSLGIALGLGMLMKFSFPVYIASPTALLVVWRIHEIKKLPNDWVINSIIVAFAGAFVAGPWYFNNFANISDFVLSAGYGEMAHNYGTGDVFTFKAITVYWASLISSGISFYYFILFSGVLILAILLHILNQRPGSICAISKYNYFLLAWIIVPFTIFTFAVNKDYRYTLPFYPAIAIISAIYILKLASSRRLNRLLLLLMIFPVFNYLYISFSGDSNEYKLGPFVLLGANLGYAHAPRSEVWPNVQLIEVIEKDAEEHGLEKILVTLLFDHPYMNHLTAGYYSVNGRGNTNTAFETIDYYKKNKKKKIVDRITTKSDYLVMKSDMIGPDFSNVKNKKINEIFDSGGMSFAKISAIPLPDNTALTIYKNQITGLWKNKQPPHILTLGPSSTVAGKGFNLQPDGGSAMWIKGENLTPSTIIVFDKVRLHGFQSGEPNVITTTVPDRLFASPGAFQIFLLDTKSGEKSNVVNFQVNK